MAISQIKMRVQFGAGNIKNIKVFDKEGLLIIRLDVHGLKVYEARIAIQNTIALLLGLSFQLEIIHGYSHGDDICSMIHAEQISKRITERHRGQKNPGISYLQVAA